MEIGNGQELGFSLFKPSFPGYVLALGAMSVATRIIGNALGATVITHLHMPPQHSGSAAEQVMDNLSLFG